MRRADVCIVQTSSPDAPPQGVSESTAPLRSSSPRSAGEEPRGSAEPESGSGLCGSARPEVVPEGSAATMLCVALVVVSAVAGFASALGGPWILDDWPLIARNSTVHSLSTWREWVFEDFWNVDVAQAQLTDRLRYFRPLVLASYALDWKLGGGAPWMLHLTNLLLHAAVALLALVTLRRWTGQLGPACLGALTFALHPTKAESVAWISGRPDVLLTAGVTLAMWGMARRLRRVRGGWALELCGAAIAYSSKEHAIVLPAFALVEAWVACGRPALDAPVLRRCLRQALPHAGAAALYLAARDALLPLRQFEISGLTPYAHAGLVLETLGRIHVLAFWPHDLSMLQSMIRTGAEGPRVHAGFAGLGASMLLIAAATPLVLRRRSPPLALAVALWLGALLPVSNLVWSGLPNLTSPRFLYLPVFALAWAAAELMRLAERRSRRGALVLAFVPLVLGLRAAERSAEFRSATAFWNGELSRHPDLVAGYLFAVEHERSRGRPLRALQLAARGFAVSARDHSHAHGRGALVVHALELAAQLTPDAARKELHGIDAFIEHVMGSQPAELRVAGIGLDVPLGAALRHRLTPRHPELSLLQADIAARLGDDERALALADRAVQACPRCAREWESAAKIALRAGDSRRARAWLAGPRGRPWSAVPAGLRGLVETLEALDVQIAAASGPARVQLEVRRHLMLGLAGRAHATLMPHARAIMDASADGALVLAEAAARAGDDAAARALLSRLPAEAVEQKLSLWKPAGARDAPLGPGDDLELEATLQRLLATPG